MLGKKGMSPLIVTILLIAFAVALGTMIMNWSSDVASGAQVSCEEVELQIQKAFEKEILCYNENQGKMRFVVKNVGSSPLDFMIYRRISANLKTNDIKMPDSYLGPGKIYEADIVFEMTDRLHIEFIPGIMRGGQEVLCTDKTIIRETLPIC